MAYEVRVGRVVQVAYEVRVGNTRCLGWVGRYIGGL